MIVESARTDRVHVSRLAALTRRKQTDNVDLGALVVLGVGIGGHVVRSRVVVDEQHARARRDRQRRGTGAIGGDGDRTVGRRWIRGS